jgi:hypothetical protein
MSMAMANLCPYCGAQRDETKDKEGKSGGFTVIYRCKTKLTVERKGATYTGAWTMMCRPGYG